MQITTLFYTSSHKCHSCFDCIQGLQQRQTRLANVMLLNCDNIYNKYVNLKMYILYHTRSNKYIWFSKNLWNGLLTTRIDVQARLNKFDYPISPPPTQFNWNFIGYLIVFFSNPVFCFHEGYLMTFMSALLILYYIAL